MLESLKNLFGRGSANEVPISKAAQRLLKADMSQLEKVSHGLGSRAVSYVLRGDDEEVLIALRSTAKAANALRLASVRQLGRRPKKNSDRRAFFDQRSSGDGDLLYRLGEIYAAAWSGHGINAQGRLWPQLPQHLTWLECLVREATNLDTVHRYGAREGEKIVFRVEDLEAALGAAGEPADWLVRAVLTEESTYGYSYFQQSYLNQIGGLGDAYARHDGTVAEVLDSAAAPHRAHLVKLLQVAGTPMAGAIRRSLERHWVGSAKTVREAIESIVVANREDRDEWLDALQRFVTEGSSGERLQAVLALGRLAPERAAELLPPLLETERSSRIRSEIERILGTAPATTTGEDGAEAEAGVYEDGLVAPQPRTYESTISLPPNFEARLLEHVERFNQQANTLHEQSWDRMDPQWRRGNRSLPEQVSAKQARQLAKGLIGTERVATKPVVELPRLQYSHLLAQDLGELTTTAALPLVGILRFGFLLGLTGNTDQRAYYGRRVDDNLLDWIRGYISREQADLTLLDLESACSAAGIPSDWIEKLHLEWVWGSTHNPFGLDADGIWPFFLQRTEGLARSLGLAHHSDLKNRAYDILKTFPRPPQRFAGYLWEQALGTSKTERQLAQSCLAGYPNREVPILGALSDGRKDIRAAAAEWLGRLGVEGAVGPLKKALDKEKYDETKAAMMEALEILGVEIDQFLHRKKLLAEAEKGLAKPIPKDLQWFPFDQIPTVRWEKNRQLVPPEILRWFIVQSFRLKSPDPNPLLRRYCNLMREDERQNLGMMVLSAWLHQDTLPRYSHAEASALADQQVARYKQFAVQYPEYATDFDEATQRKRSLHYFLHECVSSATSSKGVVALAAACCGAEAVAPVQRYLKEWYGFRLHQCKALVRMLSWIDHPLAIQAVLAIGTRFRTKGIQREAALCVDQIAERRGWSRDELADRTIPTAGFEADSTQTFDYGAREFTARLAEDFSIEIINPAGKQIKSLPAATQADDAELAKAAKRQLSASRKELKQALTMQRERLYEAMCVERRWRFEDWDLYLNQHPIVGRYCQRLVWFVERGDGSVSSFRPLPDRTLSDNEDGTVNLTPDDEVRIAHQSLLPGDLVRSWKEHLGDYEVEPLFRQFGSDLYAPDERLRETTGIADFEGHLVNSFKLRSRSGRLGYTRGPAEDGGWFHTYLKTYPSLRLQAVIEFTGNILPEENRTAALLRAYFIRQKRDQSDEWSWSHRPLKLKAVPEILLSETYSDLATMAADGSGFDPDWNKKTQW